METPFSRHTKRYPYLFSPFRLGPHTLENRLVALPVHTGFARPDGRVSDWMVDFYARLAGSGAAMVVVANTAVSADGVVSRFNLRADRDDFIPGLARLAAGIKAEGTLACIQLNHAGRFAKTPTPLLPSPITANNLAFNLESLKEFMHFFPFEKRFGLTRHLVAQVKTWIRPMTGQDRERVLRDFGAAAARAWQAGFDMVELHGANGYLICQFLSEFTNRMTEELGGDFTSRTAFPIAVIRQVRKGLPKGFPVGFRLILKEWVPDGIDMDQSLAFARFLEKEDITYVSVSAATYNSLFSPGVLKKMARPAYLKQETAALKQTVSTPVLMAGRITAAALADRLVREGTADLIGLGRPLRTDPGWVAKVEGSPEKIVPCINCNSCLKQVVLEQGFNCVQWPRWLRERTRLEHKLLSRNLSTLWVAAHPSDLETFKSYLPLLHSPDRNPSGNRILFLCPAGNDTGFMIARQAFLRWMEAALSPAGISGTPDDYTIFEPRSSWEETVLREIDRGGYGRVFLAARPDQAWRARLLYRIRGKMTGLLNAGADARRLAAHEDLAARRDLAACRNLAAHRVLVPVDLSEATLLVLRILQQTLMAHPRFSFCFIHVDTGRTDQVFTWQEANKIAGISPAPPLKQIRSREDVASALARFIQTRGYGTVVMGKRGISGIKRWLLGSVSSGVLNRLTDQSLILID